MKTYLKINNSRLKHSINIAVAIIAVFWVSCNSESKTEKTDTATEMKRHGGAKITLQLSEKDVIMGLVNNPSDSVFLMAIEKAESSTQEQAGQDYFELFGEYYSEFNKDGNRLSYLFMTISNQDEVTVNTSDADVLKYIRVEYDATIENTISVIKKRLDDFDVNFPEIKLDEKIKGLIHVVVPGIKDASRIEVLFTTPGELEFWETYEIEEIYDKLSEANILIEELRMQENQVNQGTINVDDYLFTAKDSANGQEFDPSLFTRLKSQIGEYRIYGPVVGYAKESDKESIMFDLNRESIKRLLPRDVVFAWSFQALALESPSFELFALKKNSYGKAVLGGDVITEAKSYYSQAQGMSEVSISMNGVGATEWAVITRENKGRAIAIVFDGAVYSAPFVQDEIIGGRVTISGNFSIEQATDLAVILNSGKMIPPRIINIEFVEPEK